MGFWVLAREYEQKNKKIKKIYFSGFVIAKLRKILSECDSYWMLLDGIR
jgi:hypothetical protein